MSLPRLPARDPNEHHRTATQLELLFDLISVIAIAAPIHGLAPNRLARAATRVEFEPWEGAHAGREEWER